ncbi:MAG: hypothetical protein LBI69_04990 [Puniceicoccales bacterium]|jgi:hypothetical protein|nr:hypothetical protein [Puniceicoccales bacterium]
MTNSDVSLSTFQKSSEIPQSLAQQNSKSPTSGKLSENVQTPPPEKKEISANLQTQEQTTTAKEDRVSSLQQSHASNETNETKPNGAPIAKAKPKSTEKSGGLNWETILLSMFVGSVVSAVVLTILLFAGETLTATMIVLISIGGALAGLAVGALILWWKSDDNNSSHPSELSFTQQKQLATEGKIALGELLALFPENTDTVTGDNLTAIDAKLKNFQTKLENLGKASPLFADLPKVTHGLTKDSTKENIDEFRGKLKEVDGKFDELTGALARAEAVDEVEKSTKQSDVNKAYVDLHSKILC